MPTRSLIGTPKTAVDTPALLVDLDVMELNTWKPAANPEGTGRPARSAVLGL